MHRVALLKWVVFFPLPMTTRKRVLEKLLIRTRLSKAAVARATENGTCPRRVFKSPTITSRLLVCETLRLHRGLIVLTGWRSKSIGRCRLLLYADAVLCWTRTAPAGAGGFIRRAVQKYRRPPPPPIHGYATGSAEHYFQGARLYALQQPYKSRTGHRIWLDDARPPSSHQIGSSTHSRLKRTFTRRKPHVQNHDFY